MKKKEKISAISVYLVKKIEPRNFQIKERKVKLKLFISLVFLRLKKGATVGNFFWEWKIFLKKLNLI